VSQITAQVSLYPLPKEAVVPEPDETLRAFRECAVEVEPDDLSNVLVGDDTAIFAALQQAFCHAAEQGKVVMVVTLSNDCPGTGKQSEIALES
jgi:hypothetical protein